MLLRVDRKEMLTEEIALFRLRDPSGVDLPDFTSGAHLTVRAPNGLQRKYSLCSDPAERDIYEIAVKREAEGRGGSRSMVDEVVEGDLLEAGEPQNDFPLVRSPAGYIFIAGGIGITPILSMVKHLLGMGEGRFKLYYLTRNPQMTAFLHELSRPELRGKAIIHHDRGDSSQSYDLWPALERPNGMHVYCCGPRLLMESVRDMTGHWPSTAIHFEAFTDAAARRADDVSFDVRLARSGATVHVPAGVSILEALREAGHRVPSSCESGTCGSCKTKLVEGEADHRDLVLDDGERTTSIMVCVSRAKTPELVLDL